MSFSVVSLMAMVPESEWRMPILMVSSALAACTAPVAVNARPAAAESHQRAFGRVATACIDLNMSETPAFDAHEGPATSGAHIASQAVCH